jgi:hypothetical protein
LNFASHKVECADLRKNFSADEAVRTMHDILRQTRTTDRMKLCCHADEWKSDTFADAMHSSASGTTAAPIHFWTEHFQLPLEASRLFTHRSQISIASDARCLDEVAFD